MHQVYLLSVWIHILAAMVWIGGASFIALVLVPAVRRPEHARNAPALLRACAMRFRTVGWTSLIVLVVTGCLILGSRGFTFADCFTGSVFAGPFGRTLAVKLILVTAIFAISGLHDFYLGPNAAKVILENPASSEAALARKRASWMGRIVLLLGLAVVAMAVQLVRGPF
jgi:copper resistance protein D